MDLRLFLNRNEGGAMSDEALDTLSAAEKARIIYHSRNAAQADKHRALQEIIDTLPDETVQCSDFTTKLPYKQSLHQLLKDYMTEQKRLEAAFFTSETEVVYLVDLSNTVTGESWNSGEPSLSWEACARKLTDYMEWHENTGPWQACITKYYGILDKYENISAKTCICCGQPATRITKGWISPYCDACCPQNELSVPIGKYYSDE